MYILEEELKNYREHYEEDLNAYGYYLTENTENKQVFEHESNKSEIIITLKGKMVFVNYKNSLGEIFYTCDWYIGSTEYGTYSFTDIITLMQDGNFIKFCNKEPAWKGDNEPKQLTVLQQELFDYGCNYQDELTKLGYVLIDNGGNQNLEIFEHQENKSQIHIYIQEEGLHFNLINSRGVIYNNNPYYLGLIQLHNYCFDEMYGVIESKEFQDFCNFDKTTKNIVLSPTQERIKDICNQLSSLLIYKNQKYGNSAIEPNNIFYKGDNTNSILIRLDDKLSRVKNSSELRTNDICDIIGYLVLLLVSKDVTNEEIEKLKD